MTQPERKLTDEKAVMQALWRKALELPKGLTIPCGNAQAAARLRFALYNGVRAFRKGLAKPDEALAQALAELTISFTPDKSGLVIGPKAATGMMPQLLAIIGEVPATVEELQTTSELDEMAKRMAALMVEPEVTPSTYVNPYR
jgi:hypothetical protein